MFEIQESFNSVRCIGAVDQDWRCITCNYACPHNTITANRNPVSQFSQGKNLFSLQGTPDPNTGSLFSLQGFTCKPLYFPVRDCSDPMTLESQTAKAYLEAKLKNVLGCMFLSSGFHPYSKSKDVNPKKTCNLESP